MFISKNYKFAVEQKNLVLLDAFSFLYIKLRGTPISCTFKKHLESDNPSPSQRGGHQ